MRAATAVLWFLELLFISFLQSYSFTNIKCVWVVVIVLVQEDVKIHSSYIIMR